MAKDARARALETFIDEEGYESDGMFRWGGPKKSLTEEDLKEWVDKFNEEFHRPAFERIAIFRKSLSAIITQHADGPFASPDQVPPIPGRTQSYLNLSTGKGIYLLHDDVPKNGFVNDAMSAVRELDGLEESLSQTPPNIDRVVRCSMAFGLLMMRWQMRAHFAPLVRSAIKHRKASGRGGKASAQWTAEVDQKAREIFAELKRGRMKDTPAYIRTSHRLYSEHGLEFSASTVRRHLGNSNT